MEGGGDGGSAAGVERRREGDGVGDAALRKLLDPRLLFPPPHLDVEAASAMINYASLCLVARYLYIHVDERRGRKILCTQSGFMRRGRKLSREQFLESHYVDKYLNHLTFARG